MKFTSDRPSLRVFAPGGRMLVQFADGKAEVSDKDTISALKRTKGVQAVAEKPVPKPDE